MALDEQGALGVELIVAIDLLEGRAVRLRQGRFEALRDFGDPRAYLVRALEAGARWFHIVDLTRARDPSDRRHEALLGEVLALAREAGATVEVGGGVRSWSDVAALRELGADWVVVGTALLDGSLELREPERLVAALDYRYDEHGRAIVRSHAWERSTGLELEEACRALLERGVGRQLLTDVGRDGMGVGPDVGGYGALTQVLPIELIASGGIASVASLAELTGLGTGAGRVIGAVVGTALLDGTLSLQEALRACRA